MTDDSFVPLPGSERGPVPGLEPAGPVDVAAFGIAIYVPNAQRLWMNVLELREQIALLFVNERLPVRDQELHVPHLGLVDGGVVDLVENAVRAGEPDAAGGRIGS